MRAAWPLVLTFIFLVRTLSGRIYKNYDILSCGNMLNVMLVTWLAGVPETRVVPSLSGWGRLRVRLRVRPRRPCGSLYVQTRACVAWTMGLAVMRPMALLPPALPLAAHLKQRHRGITQRSLPVR